MPNTLGKIFNQRTVTTDCGKILCGGNRRFQERNNGIIYDGVERIKESQIVGDHECLNLPLVLFIASLFIMAFSGTLIFIL